MSTLFFIGFVICNIILTVLICGYMNRKTAEQLMEYYYSDKLKAERRLAILEYNHNKLV